jgi:ankyrin repeat protein
MTFIRSSHRLTPLMFASMFGRSKVVEQLKAHGASLQQRNRLGISTKWMVGISWFTARILGEQQPQRAL